MSNPIILAAVDLDVRASAVIAHAARLAALCQGRLVVVHVVDYTGVYEDDHGFPQPPGAVLTDMVRHARASLLGMVYHLELATDWVEIQVPTGPVVDTLTDLAATRHPRYVLVGSTRWGSLSATAGLPDTLKARNGGELLVVPTVDGVAPQGLMARVRHWLRQDLAVPARSGR
jgi:nucleotide-binding universal stress UspA family protein